MDWRAEIRKEPVEPLSALALQPALYGARLAGCLISARSENKRADSLAIRVARSSDLSENGPIPREPIMIEDHVCTPISHLPAAGELVMADGMLLTSGGCAANAAVDLAKMQVRAAVVGRVGSDVLGRVVTDMLRDADVEVSFIQTSAGADTSQTLIVNVQGQDRRFVHT